MKRSSAERADLTAARPQSGNSRCFVVVRGRTNPGQFRKHGNPTCIQGGTVQEKVFLGFMVARVHTVRTTTARESMEVFDSPDGSQVSAVGGGEGLHRIVP
ncbi:hypothetical protein MTO96_045550 [Rhipicephalus appendiculatus]